MHVWEKIGVQIDKFKQPTLRWRCTKCDWVIDRKQEPGQALKRPGLLNRTTGRMRSSMTCDEILASHVMES